MDSGSTRVIECAKDELNLFPISTLQTDIEYTNECFISPLNSTDNSTAPIEFLIPGSSEYFIDLSKIFLEIQTSLRHEDGTLAPIQSTIYPETNFLHTSFSSVEVCIGDQNVTASPGNYHFSAFFQNLLNYSGEAKKCKLTSEGFYRTIEQRNDIMVSYTNTIPKRGTFYGRLLCDVLSQSSLLLNSVDVRIRLIRSPCRISVKLGVNEALPAVSPYGTQITNAGLYVTRARVSPQRYLQIERSLQNENARYPFMRSEVKTFSVGAGLGSINLPNIFSGPLPNRILIGFVLHTAFNGDYRESVFNFRPSGLTRLSLSVDGVTHNLPYTLHETHFPEQMTTSLRAYNDLMSNLGMNGNETNSITLREFSTDTTLFLFDMTADRTGYCAAHSSPLKNGVVSLQATYSVALPANLTCIAFAERESAFEVTSSRQVLFAL